MTLGRLTWP